MWIPLGFVVHDMDMVVSSSSACCFFPGGTAVMIGAVDDDLSILLRFWSLPLMFVLTLFEV